MATGIISTTVTMSASAYKYANVGTYDPDFNDGAWGLRGWTAQNMTYPDVPVGITYPSAPYATVVGNFAGPGGKGANGMVVMTPSERSFVYSNSFYELDPYAVEIRNGLVNFTVPAGSWTWDIRIRIGPTTLYADAVVVNSGTTLDLVLLTTGQDPAMINEVADGGSP